jgi:HEAT repeat protein
MSRKALIAALLFVLIGAAGVTFWLRGGARPVVPRGSGKQAEALDTTGPEAKLRDSVWQRRAAAAWSLARRTDLPVARRASALLHVLEREVVSPTDGPVFPGTWPPLTGYLRTHYIDAIEELGPDARAPVRDSYQNSRGKLRDWYGLALGATGAPEAPPVLRELLARSDDPDVRWKAAWYLGWLKDQNAVPILKAALGDTASVVPVSDVRGRSQRPIYPVREQAALALEALGFTVERRGDTFTVQ